MTSYTEQEQEQAKRMAREIQRARASGAVASIRFDVDLFELFRVIGALQLAWRHPKMDREMKEAIADFSRKLQAAFPADELPTVAETLEQGWQREYDR